MKVSCPLRKIISILFLLRPAVMAWLSCHGAPRQQIGLQKQFFQGGRHSALIKSFGRRKNTCLYYDHSASTWFRVGEQVVVVEDVLLANGDNLRGRKGVVLETWEKCEVDPTCCCAEQVDKDMAVRVEFEMPGDKKIGDDEKNKPFTYYFAEEELGKVSE